MFHINEKTRVFLKTGVTDLRFAFEGLRAVVVKVIAQPFSGYGFARCNRGLSFRWWWLPLLIVVVILVRPLQRNAWHNWHADRPVYVETRGAGPTVVLLHGLTGSHEYFAPLADALVPHYRVITPDLLGFGRSPWPNTAYSVDEHLAALMPVLPDEPFALVGHSMGALLALELARRHPGRVRTLVLLAPPSIPDRATLKRILRQRRALESRMAIDHFWAPVTCHVQEAFGQLTAVLYRPYVIAQIPDEVLRASTQHRWASYSGSLNNVVFKLSGLALIPEVSVPLTVLVGSDDAYSRNAEILRIKPDTVVIEGGHNFLWQQPQPVIAEIQRVLAARRTEVFSRTGDERQIGLTHGRIDES